MAGQRATRSEAEHLDWWKDKLVRMHDRTFVLPKWGRHILTLLAACEELLEEQVLTPYLRRGRLLTPSGRSWEALGQVLATLGEREGLRADQTPRGFIFDVLIAQSCREAGAVLVSRNTRDLARIAKITPFEFEAPFPKLA
jgi:predicted nucleic acid-binding protein